MYRPSPTLPDALAAAADRGSGEFVFHLEDGPARLSHADLAERARAGAHALIARGIGPGDTVGVLGPNRPEWLMSAFAAWAAGAVLVPLQIPLRVRSVDAFQHQVRSLVDAAACRLVLTAPELSFAVPDDVRCEWAPQAAGDASVVVAATDPAVIQFTSGSTAAPKGAVLSHAAVLAQTQAMDHILDGGAGDVVMASWVPFFHDLGLFLTLVAPAVLGATAHHLPTERFAREPAEWLRLVGRTRANVTVAPCSAWSAATRPALRGSERFDLSSLRVAWFAAEGVDPDTVDRIVAAEDRLRLDPGALGATYGLAETVLCATATRPGSGVRFDHVDLDVLAASGRAAPAGAGATRRIVCSGQPALGTRVRIVDRGVDMPERQLGEIYLQGPSLMTGYHGAVDLDPFDGGWLRTGDIGYIADGELFVTGRAKDVMIVMGRNYYPDDFEWAAGRVAGVRTGRCVAFVDAAPRERLVLLVESGAADGGARADLPAAVRHAVSDAVGTPPDEVLVLPPGTIEKTTSGKLRRSAMRDAYRRGDLSRLKAA